MGKLLNAIDLVSVGSEIGKLLRVMVERPNTALKLVTPKNFKQMLVDDVVDVSEIINEHDSFVNFLNSQEIESVNLESLLNEILNDQDLRFKFLMILFSGKKKVVEKLIPVSTKKILAYILKGEAPAKYLPVFRPAVNNMFTRDPGAIVGNVFLRGRASKPVRRKEFDIFAAVLKTHPSYSHIKHIQVPDGHTLEGGDVQILRHDMLAIGVSERTSMDAVAAIAHELHEVGFKTILAVDIGQDRASMHLDTVFTVVNTDECVVYTPIILGNENKKPARVTVFSAGRPTFLIDSLMEALEYYGMPMKTIICGGPKALNQEREQWTDGANCLTIAPGHTMTYERNSKTIAEFIKAGYIYLKAKEVTGPLNPDKKYIIGLEGFELSRARGGSHCLSFPLLRDNFV